MIVSACGRLRELSHNNVDIAIQACAQLAVLNAMSPERGGAHTQCGPSALHYCVLGRDVHSENQRRTQHAFVANDSNLQTRAVLKCGHE